MKMKNTKLYNASQKKVNSISVPCGCVLFFFLSESETFRKHFRVMQTMKGQVMEVESAEQWRS